MRIKELTLLNTDKVPLMLGDREIGKAKIHQNGTVTLMIENDNFKMSVTESMINITVSIQPKGE